MRASAALRVLTALPLALLALPALAATTPSGTTVAVIQATNATGPGGSRMLQPEAPVFTGDRVNTGAFGEAQLKFRDDTKLVVGPSSSLLIDKFIFSDENTAKSITINAVRGTFRFITGTSPKDAYVIRTPTATIGLRGTHFDFSVGAHGETRLALYHGGLRFCDRSGNCVDLTGRCDVVTAPPGRPIERISDAQKDAVLKANFPYFNKQDGLRGDFRIDRGSCSAQQSTPTAGVLPPPPPPPAQEPDCPPHEKGKHHHHAMHGDREGRFSRDGRTYRGDHGHIDDSGLRPAYDSKSRGRGPGDGAGQSNGNGEGRGAAQNAGQGDGKSTDGRSSNSKSGHNGNWSGDGGMGRGGRGFSRGR